MLAYGKRTDDGSNVVVVVVNLDPYHSQAGMVELPLDKLGIGADQPYAMHDLLADKQYMWRGPRNYVQLTPGEVAMCFGWKGKSGGRSRVRKNAGFPLALPRSCECGYRKTPMSPELFTPGLKSSLRQWLVSRRWFGGKARAIYRIETVDLIPLQMRSGGLMLLRVEYTVGAPDLYLLMFVLLDGEAAEQAASQRPAAIVHRFDRSPGHPPFLMVDALADPEFARSARNRGGAEKLFRPARSAAGAARTNAARGHPGGLVQSASGKDHCRRT